MCTMGLTWTGWHPLSHPPSIYQTSSQRSPLLGTHTTYTLYITHASHTIHTHKTYTTHNIQNTHYTWNIYYIHSPNMYYTCNRWNTQNPYFRLHTLIRYRIYAAHTVPMYTTYSFTQQTHIACIKHTEHIIHLKDIQQTNIQNTQYWSTSNIHRTHALKKTYNRHFCNTHTRNIHTTYTLTQCIKSAHHNRNTHTLTHIHTTHPSKAVYENTFTLNTTEECGLL